MCIVLLSGIGDCVHGLPIVNALKRDDPDRRVTWVVQSEGAPLLTPHPAVDQIITFDRKRGLRAVRALWGELRRHAFDIVLNFNVYFKAVVPTLFARAPNKVSFGRRDAREFIWLFANHRLAPSTAVHTQDRFLAFLDYIGVARGPLEWRIALTEEERAEQRRFFARFEGRPTLAIAATAGRASKDWPADRFARLATGCERELGFRTILVGGPGRRDRDRAEAIVRTAETDIELALDADLRRLIYLVDGADLMIAPDTGPLHISRALGTPVIGLYGHTDPRRFGPYRAYEDLLIDRFNYDRSDQAREPGLTSSGQARMSLIEVDDVLLKVELAAARYLTGDRSASTGG